ncbi:hypothetical protein DYB26_016527, partial [Aphanomyces astaci]
KYETGKIVTEVASDVDAQQEYNRQREYLEKEVESMKSKLVKGLKINHSEMMRLKRENAILTVQVNDLRREFHAVKSSQSEVNDLKNKHRDKRSMDEREMELRRESELQKAQIQQLKHQQASMLKALGGSSASGPPPRRAPSVATAKPKLLPMMGSHIDA